MAGQNYLLNMFGDSDKLDGTNYPMWAYMMKHVLVAKQLWGYVCGSEVRPAGPVAQNASASSSSSTVTSGSSTSAPPPPPTADQLRWDGRDAQAHALIALSCKGQVIPHIRSCTTAKDAWDKLGSLY